MEEISPRDDWRDKTAESEVSEVKTVIFKSRFIGGDID